MICIAGIFNLVQELLDHLVNGDIFKGNPVPVDLGLLASSVARRWSNLGIRRSTIPKT